MRLGIRRKLIGTLMLVGLLPLALSLIVILGGGAAMRLHTIRNSYEHEASQSAHDIADTLASETEKLTLLAREPDIVAYVRQQNRAHNTRRVGPAATATATAGTQPSTIPDAYAADLDRRWSAIHEEDEPLRTILTNPVAHRLRRFAAHDHHARQLLITDARGDTLAADVKTADYFQADEDWWQESYAAGKGHTSISGIVRNPAGTGDVIDICVPIYDDEAPGSPLIGILKDKLDVAWLRHDLNNLHLRMDNALVQIVTLGDDNRPVTILASEPIDDNTRNAEQAFLRARADRQRGLIGAIFGDLVVGWSPVPLEERLQPHLADASHPRWVVVVSKPSREAMTPVYRLAATVAAIGIALILVLFILGVAISNREIIMPILRLREATEAVGRGELNIRLLSGDAKDPTFRADELGALASDFDDMTRELQKTVGQLAKSNEAKRRFMELAGHELRTPVTYILSACQLAQRQLQKAQETTDETAGVATLAKASAGVNNSLGKIVLKAQRLSRIIDNLLKLVNNDQFTTRLTKQPIDMRALILQVCNDARPFVNERKQQLLVDVAENIPTFDGDRDKLEDALTNLLSNAIRFTPDGGTIRVAGHVVVGDMIEILVEDSGPGIPEKDLANLFEPFYTGTDILHHHSGTIEYGSKGIGLGLAIVRRFIEIHGGVVRAHAATHNPSGTQFQILLPLAPGKDGTADVGHSGLTPAK